MYKLNLNPIVIWNKIWFTDQPTYSLGIFRILFGLYILLILIVSFHNWDYYFGPNGFLPIYPVSNYPALFNPVTNLLNTQVMTQILFFIAVISAAMFTVGFKTKIANIILYLIFVYLFQRNPYVISGHEQITLILLFLSCFAPLGGSFSFDEVIEKYKYSLENHRPKLYSFWSVRLIQVSIALVYLFTAIDKIVIDSAWRDGTAIFYLSQFDHWFKFTNIELFRNLIISKILTYGTIITELSFPIFVWFKKTRFLMLLAVTMMHIGMTVLMSSIISFFGLAMICSMVLFIPAQTMKSFLSKFFHPVKLKLFYDGQCNFCLDVVNLLRALSSERQLQVFDLNDPKIYQQFPDLTKKELEKQIYLQTENKDFKKGFFAIQYLTRSIPELLFLAPLFYFPGISWVGVRIYNWIATHRKKFGCRICNNANLGICLVPEHSQEK